MFETPSAEVSIGIETLSTGVCFTSLFYDSQLNIKTNVNPLYIKKESVIFTSILQTSQVILRKITLPFIKEKDIQATLPFQAEPLIPYPIEDSLLEKINIEKTDEKTLLVLFAVQKSSVQQHLELFVEITPEVISTTPTAIAAYTNHFYSSQTTTMVIHLGFIETSIVVVEKGYPIASQATPPLFSNLEPPPQNELIRTLISFQNKYDVQNIIVIGEGAEKLEFLEKITPSFNIPFVIGDNAVHALSIGAALTTLEGSKHPFTNFRKEEFVYPSPYKRYMTPFLQVIFLSLIFSVSIYIFGLAYTANKEQTLREGYLDLLTNIGKSYESFEEEFLQRDTDINRPEELSLKDIEDRVDLLQKQAKSAPGLFPLQPNLPLVSDLLAWLNSHDAIRNGGLKLEMLHYSIVKRPDITKKAEKYQVKIDLEISSPTPKQAREFHDALIEPNDFIDPKGEIKWSSSRGLYRTSFLLKDKTNYKAG